MPPMNTSNLHAANATSVVGTAIAIPPRNVVAAPAAPATTAGLTATGNAAVAVNGTAATALAFNQLRTAFKPAMPAPVVPTAPSVTPLAAAATAAGISVAAATAPMAAAVPNTAGAGALNLSGRWYLDREDSDSTSDYLEAMGLPLIARQAADKLDLMVIIHQTAGDFIITRRTRIFTETKHLKFGQEVNVKGHLIKVVGDAGSVQTVTKLSANRGVITDVRTIDPRGRMSVELTLQVPDKPNVVTRRFFQKTSESTSLENLPPFDMSLETAGDVKRKR